MSFVLQLIKAYWPEYPANETPGRRTNVASNLFMDLLELEAPNLMRAPEWRQVWLGEETVPDDLVTEYQLETARDAVRTALAIEISARRKKQSK